MHWSPSELLAMPLDELLQWHGLAIERYNRMNNSGDGQ